MTWASQVANHEAILVASRRGRPGKFFLRSGGWTIQLGRVALRCCVRCAVGVRFPSAAKAWMSDLPILEPMTTTRDQSTLADLDDGPSSGTDAGASSRRDIFISHATEDKRAVARPLARALEGLGITVWFDEFELGIGDSLRQRIDDGIARSRFGLVILSTSFFDKGWPEYELNGLVAQANNNQKPLMVIWHGISKEDVITRNPSLADIVARSTSSSSVAGIAQEIASVIANAPGTAVTVDTEPLPRIQTRTSARGTKEVTLMAGSIRHVFSGVTVSPISDRQGRYFLDVRKNGVSGGDYSSLCNDLATTLGSGGWRARLNIAGTIFNFECEVTPNDAAGDSYYVDVRAHTDAAGYRNVIEALAASATTSPDSPQKEREEERQRRIEKFDSNRLRRLYLPPDTLAGQVIMGYLSDYSHWTFIEEHISGDVVELTLAVNATSIGKEIASPGEDEGDELGPAKRAAQAFHTGAEVTPGTYVDDHTVSGNPLYGYVPVQIKVNKIPN